MSVLNNNVSKVATTRNWAVAVQIQPINSAPVKVSPPKTTDEVVSDEVADVVNEEVPETETDIEISEGMEGEGLSENTSEDFIEGEVMPEPGFEGDISINPGMADGGFIDPGFIDGGFMEPGMETGMAEVKQPLLSSWPFVIGISAAIFAVSIVLGVLLARLKIKKGIDLYED